MTSQLLSKGQNLALPPDVLHIDVVLGWTEPVVEVDVSALLLSAAGKVRSDADFVFYNQPETPDGSVRFAGASATEEGAQARITMDLTALDQEVQTVALAGSLTTGKFGELGKITFRVVDAAGRMLAEYITADAVTESAFLFGEVYRRGAQWKVRAVGQGWDSGLAGLATAFGVEIDDEVSTGTAEAATAPGAVSTEPASSPDRPAGPGETQGTASDAPVVSDPKTPVRSRGIRTAKRVVRKAKAIEFALAENDTWQPARLFSVVGVGAGEEQERRATSALVATMQAVRPFARALCARMGAPAGAFEGYFEVKYERGDSKVIPDAVLRVARGTRLWTGLLEVKTGTGALKREQLEAYLDVARRKKYDAVISLSNDIPAGAGELPVEVDRRKLAKVALRHLSWAEVAHEARMLLAHGGVEEPFEVWLLGELLRYLEHPRSGAREFVDMGRHWVAVRDAVTAGTLRAGDKKALAVAERWASLSRHLALRLTAELGVPVRNILSRRYASDPAARDAAFAGQLAAEGVFEAVLRIPDTAGDLEVAADVRTNKVRCRTVIGAPDEGTSGRRLAWLLKQLSDAPGTVRIEAVYSEPGNEACEHLDAVRADPKLLTVGRAGEIVSFSLEQSFPMGARRSGTAAGFITSVTAAVDSFYGCVVQSLRVWSPAAPKQQSEAAVPVVEDPRGS